MPSIDPRRPQQYDGLSSADRALINLVRHGIASSKKSTDHADQVLDVLKSDSALRWLGPVAEDVRVARDTLDQLLRDLLIQAILAKKINQRQAADIARVHENTVARWMQQRPGPSDPRTRSTRSGNMPERRS